MDVDIITYNLEFHAAHKNDKNKIVFCKFCGRYCFENNCICGRNSEPWNLKKCENEVDDEDIIIPMSKDENKKFQKEIEEIYDLKILKEICKDNPEVKKQIIKLLEVAFISGVSYKGTNEIGALKFHCEV